MNVTEDEFYDDRRIAITPMGFCFPGLDSNGGDLPPRRECAKRWHDTLFARLPRHDVMLAIGLHAIRYHLKRLKLDHCLAPNLSATVQNWRRIVSAHADVRLYPLPHPSWRNNGWLRRNPWFESDLLPELRADVARLLMAEKGR